MTYIFYTLIGLSYLSPIFIQPWTSAFQDLCSMIALVLLIVLQGYRGSIEADKKIICIFGFIAIIPLAQYLFGILYFTQELILSLIYISIFFLSIISGINFNKSFKDINRLSTFFVLISLSCVFLQLIQWSGIYHSALILDSSSRRPFANIGQPNNLATLLFIGFFSNIFILNNKKIKIYFHTLISIILMVGIVLTQSRTSWLVFLIILIITFIKKDLGLFRYILKSSITFFLLVLTIPYATLFFHSQGLTVTERISSDSSRFYIWQQIFIAIMDKPWFGYGWNQTSVAQTSTILKYPLDIWLEYSHNLFLDIIVWTGIPIGVSIIGIVIIWFLQTFKKINTSNQLIYFLIIIAFVIHCMLEYPFAYAYFLVPVGLYSGILHQQLYGIKNLKVKSLMITIVSILIVTIIIISRDYFVFSHKKTIYASESLVSKKVQRSSSEVLILDALDMNNDILFLDRCYVIKNNTIESFRNNFYRYPTRINLIMYYNSTIYYEKYSKDAERYMIVWYPDYKQNLSQYNTCS